VARGWESKSIESQQEDASSRTEAKPALTHQEWEIEVRMQGLKLSRSRILQQIHSSKNQRYRAALEQALVAIEDQLARLK
jgi:acyl-CoA thioesterase FadM